MEEKNDNTLPMVCHLLGLAGFLGPLIIWLIKKNDSPAVNKHGKESLNFQISILIYVLISSASMVILIGFLLFPAVMIFDIVMIIKAALKANKGEDVQYPLCIRFIK